MTTDTNQTEGRPVHLRPVSDTDATEIPMQEAQKDLIDTGLPTFEGSVVDFARIKLTSVADLDTNDTVHLLDEMVRLFVEGRVVRIDHVVDEKSGRMKRIHTIKVVDAIELPWDYDVDADLERYRTRRG